MPRIGKVAFGVAACLAVSALPGAAHAAGSEASPTGKGITGGALLGAEAVMLTEAVADVKPGWAYAVGGGLGAVAGGVGGFFAEDSGNAKVSLYLLVGGMALAIPTTVAVLSATAYEPVNYTEDKPPADEPVAEPARPTSEPPSAPAAPPIEKPTGRVRDARPPVARLHAPPALLGLSDGALTLSMPAVEVRQMYTRTEVAMFGVKQRPELQVPVFNVVF